MENPFRNHYSEKSLWKKMGDFALLAGQQVNYAVLLLYYVMVDPKIAIKQRMAIAAALGYFIFPADAIPDITPIIGFSDDLGVLIFALTQIYVHITPEIKEKARQQMNEWFSKVDQKQLLALEEKISGTKSETDNQNQGNMNFKEENQP